MIGCGLALELARMSIQCNVESRFPAKTSQYALSAYASNVISANLMEELINAWRESVSTANLYFCLEKAAMYCSLRITQEQYY